MTSRRGGSNQRDDRLEPFRPDDTPLVTLDKRTLPDIDHEDAASDLLGTTEPGLHRPVANGRNGSGTTVERAEAPPAAGRRRRWLRPVLAFAAAVLLIGALAGLRDLRAKTELRRVEKQWLAAKAVNERRYDVARQVENRTAADDAPAAREAMTALDTEAAEVLVGVGKRLEGNRLIDSGVRRVRDAATTWIGLQAAAWRTHLPEAQFSHVKERSHVDEVLAQVSRRWGHRQSRQRATPPTLRAADGLLARLDRYFDEPTGLHLLSSEGQIFRVIDVDASRQDRRLPTGVNLGSTTTGPRHLTERATYIGFVVTDGAYAVDLSAAGQARRLGAGNTLFAAARPDAVWVAETHPTNAATLYQTDGNGTVLAGPFTVPGSPVAEVRGGVLMRDLEGGLSVWDPATKKVVRRVTTTGDWVSSSTDAVAWTAFDGPRNSQRVHVTSLVGKPEQVVELAEGALTSIEAFSPDGKQLAVVGLVNVGNSQVARLSVLDIDTGVLKPIGGDLRGASIVALTWTPGGDRVVVATTAALPVYVWRVGEDRLRQLRLGGIRFQSLLTLSVAS